VIPIGLLLSLVPALAGPLPAAGRSLWQDGKSLTADYRAARVGDQLTILIVEVASGSNQARTKTEKDTQVGVDAGPGLGALDFIPLIKFDATYLSDHEGKGQTTRANNVKAKITVTVSAVRPNGDLEVTGTRQIKVNAETHNIMITGVVRTRDIADDNTVLSTYVGDARVEYTGSGAVTGGTKVGFWKRLLDLVF
jgi:flagellar L-ring protein precursor FlgH